MVVIMENNNIIDIHSHILYGVDDGCSDIDKSINILKRLEDIGFCSIVLTSHFIEDTSYNIGVKERKKILNNLKKNTNINLYLGNEVLVTDNILELFKDKKLTTLNNSRYMLIEFSFNEITNKNFNILRELIDNDITPVIAHPERYLFLQEDKSLIDDLIDMGCIFQCNVSSIVGRYGRRAKKLVKYLLKNDLVTFVGSDIHSLSDIDEIEKGYKKLYKLVKEDKYKEITYINPKKVINNERVV